MTETNQDCQKSDNKEAITIACNVSLIHYQYAGRFSGCSCGYYMGKYNSQRQEWRINTNYPTACAAGCSAPTRIYDPYYTPSGNPNGDCAILCCVPNPGSSLTRIYSTSSLAKGNENGCLPCLSMNADPSERVGAFIACEDRGESIFDLPNSDQKIQVLHLQPEETSIVGMDHEHLSADLTAETIPVFLKDHGVTPHGNPGTMSNTGYYVGMYDSVFKAWYPCEAYSDEKCPEDGFIVPPFLKATESDIKSLKHGTVAYCACIAECPSNPAK